MKQENEVIGIPLGYKRTDVGVIPQDWQVVTIGQLAHVFRGASPRPIDSPVWFDSQSKTGWLRISDVTASGKFLDDTTQNLSVAGIENSRFVKSGNLVMSICATVGRPIITRKDVCIHDGFVVFHNLQADKEYLYYYLSNMETGWSKHGQTGSQMNLNTDLIDSTTIPFPPPAEQRAIAGVLSDVDELLGSVEKLIAKKQAIKQAAMQQLLTGKTRLPGFSGAWERKKIAEVATYCNEKNNSDENLPVLTCSKHLGFVDSLSYFRNQVFSKDLSGYNVIRRGQIGYPANHIEEGSIGLQDIYDVALVSPIYVVFSPNEDINSYFLHRLLKLDRYRQEFSKATTASVDRRGSLRWPTFSELIVNLPYSDEQEAIAAVLSDMDAETAALERRRDKTRAIKQGMMQQLLTGRVRLVKPE